jgi:hypothetical protein
VNNQITGVVGKPTMVAKVWVQTGGDESVDALRRLMLAVGEQLIAELVREDKLSERGFKHPDDATILKEWKESRSMVEGN